MFRYISDLFRRSQITNKTNYEYVQMEIKEDPPSHMKLCGEISSFHMILAIFGDQSWNCSISELFQTTELTIAPKTNSGGTDELHCSLQLLKMATIGLLQEDDFTIMPTSMFFNPTNGTEKLMMYKELKAQE